MRLSAALLLAALALLVSGALPVSAHAAGSPRLDRAERALIRAINRQRGAAGLRGLHARAGLDRAADFHSREMLRADRFAHESPDGTPMQRRVRRFVRARMLGETIAMIGGGCGRGLAGTVVRLWMHSPGHRAVLLTRGFKRIGVAHRTGRLGAQRACLVTADFTR